MNSLLENLSPLNILAGLDVHHSEGRYHIAYTILERQNDELRILESGMASSITSLSSQIRTEIPLVVSFRGNGVVLKKEGGKFNSLPDLFQKALPSANPAEFQISSFTFESETWMYFLRIREWQELIVQLSDMQFSILGVMLGDAPLFSTAGLLLSEKGQSLELESFRLQYSGAAIQLMGQAEPLNRYQFEDLVVQRESLYAFCTALSYLLGDTSSHSNHLQIDGEREWRHRQLYKKTALKALFASALMVVLCIGMRITLGFQNDRLNAEYSVVRGLENQIDSLEQRIDRKREFQQLSGWSEPSRTTFYLDRLLTSIPEGVKLQSLNVYPPDEQISGKPNNQQYLNNTIRIKGTTAESMQLHEWQSLIDTISWVRESEITAYEYDRGKITGLFTLEIYL